MARTIMVPHFSILIENASADEIHELAKEITRDIRSNIRAAGLVDSGALLKSVRVRRLVRGSRIYIGNKIAWYWAILEYGAPAHMIRAAVGKVLRFVKRNGEVVFARFARHPGNRAYGFVRRAVYKRRIL